MKLEKIIRWLDRTLDVAAFDDVSNNGLQVDRSVCEARQSEPPEEIKQSKQSNNQTISTVAFAVDASVRAVEAAAKAGAQLLVVHHGISWGGGIKRVSGGVGRVIRAAIKNNLAVYACHLPLDAHPTLGNNAQLAKLLGLKRVKPAFNYHGNVIGLVGECLGSRLYGCLTSRKNGFQVSGLQASSLSFSALRPQSNNQTIKQSDNFKLGICSGGAGEFAEEAKDLGCDVFLTGEASWGDVIAAENCGMRMLCLGHYETEVWGVRAVAAALKKALKLKTVDLTETLRQTVGAI